MPTLYIRNVIGELKINGVTIASNPTQSVSYPVSLGATYTIETTYPNTIDNAKFSRYWGTADVTIANKNAQNTTFTVNADNQTIIIYSKYKMVFIIKGSGTLSAASILQSGTADPNRNADEWNNISGLNAEGFGWFESISPSLNYYPYKVNVTFTADTPYQFYEYRGGASGTSTSTDIEIAPITTYAITSIPITLKQTIGGAISDPSGEITNDTNKTITKYYPYGYVTFTAVPSTGYNVSYWEDSMNSNSYGNGHTTMDMLIGLSLQPNTIITVTFAPTGVVCFLADTPILTPSGYTPIHKIHKGGFVITADGRTVRVRRALKQKHVLDSRIYPYIIPKGMFGALEDIAISPSHEVLVPGKGMMKACALGLERKQMRKPFYYYNLELEDWVTDNLVAAGVECESLAPAERVRITKAEFMTLVYLRYGATAAKRLRTVCFEESSNIISMPKFKSYK